MAKQKKLTKSNIVEAYMAYIGENGKRPKTIFHLMKVLGYPEQEFYTHFVNFDILDRHIMAEFCNHTLSLIKKNKAFVDYSAKEQLLSFYFTFFELLTANRSYVNFIFENRSMVQLPPVFRDLRFAFKSFIREIEHPSLDFMKNSKLMKAGNWTLDEAAWVQFLFTIKYYLNDTSPSFEKTDLLIEKSINAGFEVLDIKQFDKVIDFGKFIIKETLGSRVN